MSIVNDTIHHLFVFVLMQGYLQFIFLIESKCLMKSLYNLNYLECEFHRFTALSYMAKIKMFVHVL